MGIYTLFNLAVAKSQWELCEYNKPCIALCPCQLFSDAGRNAMTCHPQHFIEGSSTIVNLSVYRCFHHTEKDAPNFSPKGPSNIYSSCPQKIKKYRRLGLHINSIWFDSVKIVLICLLNFGHHCLIDPGPDFSGHTSFTMHSIGQHTIVLQTKLLTLVNRVTKTKYFTNLI